MLSVNAMLAVVPATAVVLSVFAGCRGSCCVIAGSLAG